MSIRRLLFRGIFDMSARCFESPHEAMGWPSEEEHRALTEHLGRILAPGDGDRVLDMGCGTGHALATTVPSSATGVGLEPQRSLLERRVKDARLTYVQGEGWRLPFRDASFDRVSCTSVFQYLESLDEASRTVGEMVRVLRPGGRILLADLHDSRRKGWFPSQDHQDQSAFARPWLRWLQIPASMLFYHLLRWYHPDQISAWCPPGSRASVVSRPPQLVNAHECFDVLIEKDVTAGT